MLEFEKTRHLKQMPKLLNALQKKQYDAYFFETIDEARSFIPTQIKAKETIGVGGSMTLRKNLGIVDLLRDQGNTVYDHWDAKNKKKRIELKRMQRGVDVFFSSVNAITCDGIMVNLDGGGNRVGGLCSGPKKAIVVVGTNKIVETLELAIHRTRQQAAILNALRLGRKVPCAKTGICTDCNAAERICAALLILFKKPNDLDNFTVILVNEEMGY